MFERLLLAAVDDRLRARPRRRGRYTPVLTARTGDQRVTERVRLTVWHRRPGRAVRRARG